MPPESRIHAFFRGTIDTTIHQIRQHPEEAATGTHKIEEALQFSKASRCTRKAHDRRHGMSEKCGKLPAKLGETPLTGANFRDKKPPENDVMMSKGSSQTDMSAR